jgi:hypothetical protein
VTRRLIAVLGLAVLAVASAGAQVSSIPAVLTGGTGTAPFTQVVTSVSSIAITHNLGSSTPWVTCYDGSGNLLGGATATTFISNVVANSTNQVTVTFSGSTTGTCLVSTGSMGPAGSTGATGATGPAGSNGSNGTNGAISQIQANGSNQTVEPKLNLKSGTNATVSCADNAGLSTDCTVSASGGTLPTSAGVLGTDGSANAIAATAHGVALPHVCIAASASSTTYTCSTTPTFTPVAEDLIYFKADVASTTTTPSVNANGAGSKVLRSNGGTIGIASGTFGAGGWYLLIYDGTNWNILSTPAIIQNTSNFMADTSGSITGGQIQLLQSAGSANFWQVMAPGSKLIAVMADHQFLWRSSATGSIFSAGSYDTGLSRVGVAAVGVGNGTQGTISGTLQAGVTATDPGCTTAAHIGKQWFNIATTTTVYQECLNAAGTVGWGTNINVATGTSLALSGSLTSGVGSGVAGALNFGQGTLPTLVTNAVSLLAPTSVTAYGLQYPASAPSANQVLLWGTPSGGISTGVFTNVALLGSTNVFSANSSSGVASSLNSGAWASGLTSCHTLIQPAGVTAMTSAGGAAFCINAPTGNSANFITFTTNGSNGTQFSVTNNGSLGAFQATFAGGVTATNHDTILGGKFRCTHGTTAATCGVATLSSGTVTVSTTGIGALATTTSGSVVTLNLLTCSSCGVLSVGTVTPGTSFVINSSNGSDASSVYWEIRNVL